MSIKPIDLQTLFAKMDEVSKEQALMKEQATLQQSQAARFQVMRKLEEDHMVTQTPAEEETQAIKDNDSNNKQKNKGHKRERRRNKSSENDKEVVTDPEVGRHINLSS